MASAKRHSFRVICLCLVLALLAPLLFSGCRQQEPQDAPIPPAETPNDDTAQDLRFVYLCEDLSLLSHQSIAEGLSQRCEQLGVSLTVVDAEGRSEVLMSYIDDLDAGPVDALLISVLTEPLGPLIQSKCSALGIPVFAISSRLRDQEGQQFPGIEISAYECGAALASRIAGAIVDEGALDMEEPISVVMCKMSSITAANEVVNGFFSTFTRQLPQLDSDSYTQLEVLSPTSDGQYFSLSNYFKNRGSKAQYVFVTFNDDGGAGIVQFLQKMDLEPDRILFGTVGGQAALLDSLDGEMAKRYFGVLVDYVQMGADAADLMIEHLEDGQALPRIFAPVGEIVTEEESASAPDETTR